jgi:hypothetical protein
MPISPGANANNRLLLEKKEFISEKTVRNHISNAMQKLGVKGRSQAVVELLRIILLFLFWSAAALIENLSPSSIVTLLAKVRANLKRGSSVEEKRQSGQLDGAGERHSARLNG